MKAENEKPVRRLSIDLRGDNVETFEAFRRALAKELGFEVSATRAVLYAINKVSIVTETNE